MIQTQYQTLDHLVSRDVVSIHTEAGQQGDGKRILDLHVKLC